MERLAQYLSAARAALTPYRRHVVAGLAAVLIVASGYYLFAAPASFSPDTLVTISYGTSMPEIANELADANVIRHPAILRLILRVSGESGALQTGVYKFSTRENVFTVAYRLIAGDYGLPPVRITFIEGATVDKMASQVAQAFPNISARDFSSLAQSQQGYLFPDTYIFQPSATAESIVTTMRSNFDTKLAPLLSSIGASGHSLSDTIIMASIIEKEAKTDTDKHIVAGILWHRLALKMPLQVDAAKETYQHIGLTPAPICNPGLDTIEAAISPTKTNYLYYLTGHDGLMHYATTFAGHQANLRKYLN